VANWNTIGTVVVLGRERRRCAACGNQRHLPANQIGGQRRQSIIVSLRKAVLDGQVLAFDVANRFQRLPEGDYTDIFGLSRIAAQPPDRDRRGLLLRARRDRTGNRAAEQRDEVAAFHAHRAKALHEFRGSMIPARRNNAPAGSPEAWRGLLCFPVASPSVSQPRSNP
jgi:hypothetical protein